MRRKAFVICALLLLFSLRVFAFEFKLPNENEANYVYDIDIPWNAGNIYGYRSGYWGFSYNWDPILEEAKLQPYYNIEALYRRWNKTIRGPLVEGGQSVITIIGAHLDANYSPYVAYLDENILGMRIHGYKYELAKFGTITIDGTYIFGYLNKSTLWKGTELSRLEGDYALNVKGYIGKFRFNNSALRYYNESKDSYFLNYALEGTTDFFQRKMTLSGVYANYQENDDWLYELHYNWNLIPGFIRIESSLRNSEFKNLSSIRGPQESYIRKPEDPEEHDLLEEIDFLGHCFNIGPTIWFKVGAINNMLRLDYASTARADFYSTAPIEVPGEPRKSMSLVTNYQNLTFQNTYYKLRTDEATRSFYRLGVVATPGYELPFGLDAAIRLDLDFDMNYSKPAESQVFSLAGLRLNAKRDIWMFKNVDLYSYFILGLAGEDYRKVDPFKYSLMAKYDAPNGLRFRLQYFSSDDFKTRPRDIFGKDRYGQYRWYRNDFGKTGLRLVVAVPF